MTSAPSSTSSTVAPASSIRAPTSPRRVCTAANSERPRITGCPGRPPKVARAASASGAPSCDDSLDRRGCHERLITEQHDDRVTVLGQHLDARSKRCGLSLLPVLDQRRFGSVEVDRLKDLVGAGAKRHDNSFESGRGCGGSKSMLQERANAQRRELFRTTEASRLSGCEYKSGKSHGHERCHVTGHVSPGRTVALLNALRRNPSTDTALRQAAADLSHHLR
jgi:hypothetical protein